jgi:hypothetical protein
MKRRRVKISKGLVVYCIEWFGYVHNITHLLFILRFLEESKAYKASKAGNDDDNDD